MSHKQSLAPRRTFGRDNAERIQKLEEIIDRGKHKTRVVSHGRAAVTCAQTNGGSHTNTKNDYPEQKTATKHRAISFLRAPPHDESSS